MEAMNFLTESMFGGGMFCARNKSDDKLVPLIVTLEDLYMGKTVTIPHQRDVLCFTCRGKGGKIEAMKKCTHCNGQGIIIAVTQIMPGFSQRSQRPCSYCQGEGTHFSDKDKCKKCKGKKIVQERSNLEVIVEAGMKNGDKLRFPGRGDQAVDLQPGDCYVILRETEHKFFQRADDHLLVTLPLTLTEALCGFQTVIQHLDGRPLLVQSRVGEVIKPGDILRIPGKGMPRRGRPGFGDIVVKFDLRFPENHYCDIETLNCLEMLLPPRQETVLPSTDEENVEEVTMFDLSPEDARQSSSNSNEDDDDEVSQVQCAHQ